LIKITTSQCHKYIIHSTINLCASIISNFNFTTMIVSLVMYHMKLKLSSAIELHWCFPLIKFQVNNPICTPFRKSGHTYTVGCILREILYINTVWFVSIEQTFVCLCIYTRVPDICDAPQQSITKSKVSLRFVFNSLQMKNSMRNITAENK